MGHTPSNDHGRIRSDSIGCTLPQPIERGTQTGHRSMINLRVCTYASLPLTEFCPPAEIMERTRSR